MPSPISNNQYQISYSYDPVGRFHQVDAAVPAASVSQTFRYTYLPGSDLIHSLRETNTSFSVTRTYEPNRNLITQILNTSGTNSVSQFDYANDAVGRRTLRVDSASVTNAFDYNARSELIDALMGTNSHSYRYDPIGNRRSASEVCGLMSNVSVYAANPLNQYTNILEGGVPTTPHYDSDGNLLSYGAWNYTWDAENRLIGVSSNGQAVADYAYDYMSRRYRKVVGGTTNTFLYDGWAMIREVSGAATNNYVYGLDLSGTPQGAGTIGGILSATRLTNNDSPITWFYAYDANGNVADLAGIDGAVAAHYQYDPYGNTVLKTGALADVNPFKFSTKYNDAETGWYYYGHRFYSPGLGRWVSRDPIGERGGLNIHVFVRNSAIDGNDLLGRQALPLPEPPVALPPGWRWIEVGRCCPGSPPPFPSPATCIARCLRIGGAFIQILLCPPDAEAPVPFPDYPPIWLTTTIFTHRRQL